MGWNTECGRAAEQAWEVRGTRGNWKMCEDHMIKKDTKELGLCLRGESEKPLKGHGTAPGGAIPPAVWIWGRDGLKKPCHL